MIAELLVTSTSLLILSVLINVVLIYLFYFRKNTLLDASNDASKQANKIGTDLLLQHSNYYFYSCDLTCRVNYISPSVTHVLGYTSSEFAQPGFLTTIIFPDDLSFIHHVTGSSEHNRPHVLEYRVKHADGSWRWIRDNRMVIEHDGSVILVGSCMDFTDRKEVELKLLTINNELEELRFALNEASIVSITDSRGYIKYANKKFEDVSQYSVRELVGKKHNIINSGYHSNKFWKDMWRTISNGEVWRADVKNKAKDDSIYWVDTAIIPIKDISGKIIEYISIRNEITEKKRNEDQLQLLSLIAKTTSNFVMITDINTNIEWVNESFERFTGYKLDEIKGKNPGSILQGPETDKNSIRYLSTRLRERKPYQGELLNYTKQGEKYWIDINVQPIKDADGKVTRFFAIMRNVTEQRWLVENLTTARQKAEESDRLKSAFLANMSHEIRTPMNAIMGFSELLGNPNLDSRKREEFVRLIQVRSQDLLTIVNDILDISKIESGQMITVPVVGNIQELFEKLQSHYSAEAKHLNHKSVEIKYYNHLTNDRSLVLADFIRLHQVLNNLLSNALKFTNQGTIEFGCKLLDKDTLLFEVKDTGIGIDPDKQKTIFKPFQQASLRIHQQYGGTGLGLSIIDGLVKLWNGKVWVDSEPGRGSAFYFTMPYLPQHNKSLIEIPVMDHIDWSERKILLVEDDIYSANYIREILTDTHCEIVQTDSGIKAIELVAQSKPDIILLDFGLPDIGGLEVLEHLINVNPNLQIIPITAFATSDYKLKAKQLGCEYFLTKPISQKRLLKTIAQLLAKKEQSTIEINTPQ